MKLKSIDGKSLLIGSLLGGIAVFGIAATEPHSPEPLDYKVVSAGDGNFQLGVKDAFKKGWIPLGGVSYSRDGFGTVYAQAMVKYR